MPDDATRAAARDLAAEGIAAYQAGDFANARRKLEKAYRLFATPTLGLWSARASFQLGHWVEAAERFREAQHVSAAVGDADTQRQAQKDASDELAALSPRIPAVTIELEDADAVGVVLQIDGTDISTELLGVRRPMNPGKHRVEASRGGVRTYADVQLAEKEHHRVIVRWLESASGGAQSPVDATNTKPYAPARAQAQAIGAESSPPPSHTASEGSSGRERARVNESEVAKTLEVQSLLREREYWQSRNTGLGAPVLFTGLGAVTLISAVVLAAIYGESHRCDFYKGGDQGNSSECLESKYEHWNNGAKIASITTGIASLALFGVATGFWVSRTSEETQGTHLKRIDDRLKALRLQTSINPWIEPARGGAVGGLQLALRF